MTCKSKIAKIVSIVNPSQGACQGDIKQGFDNCILIMKVNMKDKNMLKRAYLTFQTSQFFCNWSDILILRHTYRGSAIAL